MGCLALWQLLGASLRSDADGLADLAVSGDQSTLIPDNDGFLAFCGLVGSVASLTEWVWGNHRIDSRARRLWLPRVLRALRASPWVGYKKVWVLIFLCMLRLRQVPSCFTLSSIKVCDEGQL